MLDRALVTGVGGMMESGIPSAIHDSTAAHGLCALGERLSTFACIP
jgi:hypothetical protein